MTKIEKKIILIGILTILSSAFLVVRLNNAIEKIDRDEFLNSVGETIGKVKQGMDKYE